MDRGSMKEVPLTKTRKYSALTRRHELFAVSPPGAHDRTSYHVGAHPIIASHSRCDKMPAGARARGKGLIQFFNLRERQNVGMSRSSFA